MYSEIDSWKGPSSAARTFPIRMSNIIMCEPNRT